MCQRSDALQASVAATLSDGVSRRRHKFAEATPEHDGLMCARGSPRKYI